MSGHGGVGLGPPGGGETTVGSPVLVDVGLMGHGTTEATDFPTITPGQTLTNSFICAVKRANTRSTSGGLSIRIIDPGTNLSGAELGEGDTPSTLRATLRILAVREDPLGGDPITFPLGPALVLCDHTADPVDLAEIFELLELAASNAVDFGACERGDLLQVLYEETGDVGAYVDPAGDVGTRPQFQILDWPLLGA